MTLSSGHIPVALNCKFVQKWRGHSVLPTQVVKSVSFLLDEPDEQQICRWWNLIQERSAISNSPLSTSNNSVENLRLQRDRHRLSLPDNAINLSTRSISEPNQLDPQEILGQTSNTTQSNQPGPSTPSGSTRFRSQPGIPPNMARDLSGHMNPGHSVGLSPNMSRHGSTQRGIAVSPTTMPSPYSGSQSPNVVENSLVYMQQAQQSQQTQQQQRQYHQQNQSLDTTVQLPSGLLELQPTDHNTRMALNTPVSLNLESPSTQRRDNTFPSYSQGLYQPNTYAEMNTDLGLPESNGQTGTYWPQQNSYSPSYSREELRANNEVDPGNFGIQPYPSNQSHISQSHSTDQDDQDNGEDDLETTSPSPGLLESKDAKSEKETKYRRKSEKKIFFCTECDASFKDYFVRDRHEKEKHFPVKYLVCQVDLAEGVVDPLNGHLRCNFCPFFVESEEQAHLIQHHIAEAHNTSACTDKPMEGRKMYHRADRLKEHLNKDHNLVDGFDEWKNMWKKEPGKWKAWGCGFCTELLESWQIRRRHLSNHTMKDNMEKRDWKVSNVIRGLLKRKIFAELARPYQEMIGHWTWPESQETRSLIEDLSKAPDPRPGADINHRQPANLWPLVLRLVEQGNAVGVPQLQNHYVSPAPIYMQQSISGENASPYTTSQQLSSSYYHPQSLPGNDLTSQQTPYQNNLFLPNSEFTFSYAPQTMSLQHPSATAVSGPNSQVVHPHHQQHQHQQQQQISGNVIFPGNQSQARQHRRSSEFDPSSQTRDAKRQRYSGQGSSG
jgi:hypothetical protein